VLPWENCPENWPYIWPKVDERFEGGYTLWISRAEKKMIKAGERERPDNETLKRIVNWP
jgi:hypothetical protein